MKNPAPQPNTAILAVLHRAGRTWQALIADASSGKPSITATREFNAETIAGLDHWLDQHQAVSVLCVLPAANVICRNTVLPDAPPEQLEQALRLQAEAQLLGIAPPHRLALAVLPASPGETSRSGIILAWPESSTFEGPRTARPMQYVADIAALAALLNGQRPDDAMLWLDRNDGSVALALTHANGAIFRATREEADSNDGWSKSVGRIVAETALSVGHSGAFVENAALDARKRAGSLSLHEGGLFLPREVIESAASRLNGAPMDARWWKENGVAAGALLARAGQLAPLTVMMHTPALEKPSRVRRTLEALATPRAATLVVLACLAVLMLAPLVVAGVRLGILAFRFGNIDQQRTTALQAKADLVVYEELRKQKVWPMTKLLSDIATNTPLGIELESIRIEGGKDFAVSGTAIAHGERSPTEIVGAMQENLRRDGLFNEISVSWGDSNNLGMYQFDLSAKVARPYSAPEYDWERDFRWTYADRRDGKPRPDGKPSDNGDEPIEIAANTGERGLEESPPLDLEESTGEDGDREGEELDPDAARGLEQGGDERPATGNGDAVRPSRRGTSGGRDDAVMPGDEGAADGPRPSTDIPEPLSEDEIKNMSVAELRAALAKVSAARQFKHEDPEVDPRLKREFDMLMEQLRKGGKP